MFRKVGYSSSELTPLSSEAVLADPIIVERMTKLAHEIKSIAPKSDDFLYFSIIFLKAAESALIDEKGDLKKIGRERAWGYFDENWRWHGNVRPHKNNNCFLPGTKILMSDCSTKDIEDIVAGDVVITHTGSQKKVITTTRTRYDGDILNIKVRNKESVSCTPEHPFYSVKHKNPRLRLTRDIANNNMSFSFDEASSLKKGSFLTSPVLRQYVESNVTPKLARLFGIFAAEGSYTKKYGRRQGLLFTVGKTEEAQADLISSIAESEFPGCSVRKNYSKKNSTINITVTGSGIAELFYKNIGEYSHAKKLSENIVFGNDEVKKQFLIGWLDGDGCLTNYNKIIGITTSPHIAYQAHMMLNSLGISSSLKSSSWCKSIIAPTNGKSYLARKHYRLDVNGTGCRELGINSDSAKYCGLFDDKIKNKKFDIFTDNHSVHSVSSVEGDKYDGFVYNFQVEDDNSYVANGLVVHNCDIFPESELKKAARDWIGKPLCKDHISDSVDGIRGIILDTHYDEKLKQVVGLCALDRINYADLAKKVETGIVRYGSMGTAVEVSVCSECGNKAKTAKEYCDHVTKRSAWGEINVGLKPIEYSLVVQPAESGAVLLKCIASLKSYRDEFINYGVDNFEEMLGSLSSDQAQHLNTIVKTACGDDGCSITERKKIITSFLTKNNLLKVASEDAPVVQGSPQHMESFTSGQTANPITGLVGSDDFDVKDYTGASGSLIASPSEPNEFQAGGVIPDNTWDAKAAVSKFAAEEDYSFNKSMLSSVLEDIMYESSLKKRAELRRKLAYHQGGADKAVEPATFKKEMFSFEEDKQMHQDGKMGGAQGSFPGDQELKGKLSRAQLEERRLRRLAYFQGASEGAEPKTFKSEPFPFDEDKQMHQDGKMGGDKGMFPGDQQLKEKMKRASYEGPALSTKLSWALSPSGQMNKSAALFEVFAGDRQVIAATGSEIFGDEISQNWDWFTSKEYGQEVCKQIRASGLDHVTMLLKGAQAMPPAPPMGPDAAPPAPPMPPMPPMPSAASEAPEMPEMSDEGDDSPKKTVEDALVSIEEAVAKARDALGKIEGGGKVTVNIDAEKGDADVESGGEEVKLSREISQQLKVALAELDESADELAMIAETYENAHRLSSEHVADLNKIARDSLRDADRVLGQTSALTKMASSFASVMTKTAKVVYAEDYQTMADDSSDMDSEVGDMSSDMHDILNSADDSDDDVQDLVSMAMDLRRARREEILVQAAKKKAPAKAVPAKPSKAKMKAEEKEEEEAPKAAKKMKPADKAEKSVEEDEPKAKKSDDAKEKKTASLKEIVSEAFSAKKADQDREVYKLKLRRAFDVALEMQKKGLIGMSKTALDKQVDDIMDFDDRAFEAFKRSVANAKSISSVKIATDLGGVNVGVESSEQAPSRSSSEILKMLWE